MLLDVTLAPLWEGIIPVNPLGTLAFGFKGDNAPLLLATGGAGEMAFGNSPPVTLRRMGGRPAVGARPGLSPINSPSLSKSGNPEIVDVSAPSACRRAFSCLACTERKCRSSSCHLMSSRPIFERLDIGPIVLEEVN